MDDPLPLVDDAKAGCPVAKDQLARMVLSIAQQTARQLSPDAAIAEDIAQDATLRAFVRLDSFKAAWRLSTWVRVITRNTYFDFFRREKKRQVGLPFEPVCPALGPDRLCELKQSAVAVHSALDQLSPLYRQAVVMHHFGHLKHREVAAALGIPVGTVMNRMFRARRLMRAMLKPTVA